MVCSNGGMGSTQTLLQLFWVFTEERFIVWCQEPKKRKWDHLRLFPRTNTHKQGGDSAILSLSCSTVTVWCGLLLGPGVRWGVVLWPEKEGPPKSYTDSTGFSLQSSLSTLTPLWNMTRSGICFKVIQDGWESRWRARWNKTGHELITVHVGS